MSVKNKIFFAIVIVWVLIGALSLIGFLATSVEAADAASESKIDIAALGLPPGPLNLVALSPLIAGEQTLGTVVIYDDPATPRPADYIELYNGDGNLVAVGWFDRFGIQRVAVDRAFVDGEDRLEGVLVAVLDGNFI